MLHRSPMKHNCRQISGEITWMRIKEHLSALILLKLFTRHPGYWLRSVTQWVAPTGPWFVPPLQQRIKCPGIKDLLGNTWQIKQNPWNCISVRGSFSAATTWQRRRLVAGMDLIPGDLISSSSIIPSSLEIVIYPMSSGHNSDLSDIQVCTCF